MDGSPVDAGAGSLLRNSGLLLAARGVQALFGAATFVVLTRRLGPDGFGEVVIALGVASVVGGVLGAALSDAAVMAGAQLPRLTKITGSAAALTLLATTLTWLISGGDSDAVLAAVGSALFVSASGASASRTALARTAGDARGLAFLQAAGALAALVTVAALAASGVRGWGPYVVAYAVQPASLLLLRAPQRGTGDGTAVAALHRVVRLSGPFLVSQAVWPMFGLTNLVVLRVMEGPGAVGRYGAMVRMLDLVSVAGPLLGTFALPAFARLQRGWTDGARSSPQIARLNLTIAAAGTLPVVAGMHLAWGAWRVAYPDLGFPTVAFGVLAAAYGLNSACGLPDRVLQSAGGAARVAGGACAALAALVVSSPLLVSSQGLTGAALALLFATGGVNVAMLAWTRPPPEAVPGHLSIMVVVGGSAAVVASGWALGSVARSLPLVAGTAALVVLVVMAADRRLRAGLPPT